MASGSVIKHVDRESISSLLKTVTYEYAYTLAIRQLALNYLCYGGTEESILSQTKSRQLRKWMY